MELKLYVTNPVESTIELKLDLDLPNSTLANESSG